MVNSSCPVQGALHCDLEGLQHISASQLIWKKDGAFKQIGAKLLLVSQNATADMSGRYTCFYNGLVRANVTVIIQGEPMLWTLLLFCNIYSTDMQDKQIKISL